MSLLGADKPPITPHLSIIYWSSVENTTYRDSAWYFNFKLCVPNYYYKSCEYYVRCVRGGHHDSSGNLVIAASSKEISRCTFNGNGTVTDNLTGLMWEANPGEEAKKTGRSLEEEIAWLEYLLSQIIQSLPEKRDWLDPEIEKAARQVAHG